MKKLDQVRVDRILDLYRSGMTIWDIEKEISVNHDTVNKYVNIAGIGRGKYKFGNGNDNPNYGKPLSESTRKKLSEGRTGDKNWFKGRKHSLETRQIISEQKVGENQSGDKNPNWKGGIAPQNALLRSDLRFKAWREAVYQRDNYTCKICDTRGGKLNAHHIKPFAEYEDLRFDINNGETLCFPCHRWAHSVLGNKEF